MTTPAQPTRAERFIARQLARIAERRAAARDLSIAINERLRQIEKSVDARRIATAEARRSRKAAARNRGAFSTSIGALVSTVSLRQRSARLATEHHERKVPTRVVRARRAMSRSDIRITVNDQASRPLTALIYSTAPLHVLALWEPHAILCVAPDPSHGGKPGKLHETRSWAPRGPFPFYVAIHAAKKFDADIKDSIATPAIREALIRCGFYPGDPRPFATRRMSPPNGMKALPLGAIVGLATVVYAKRMATEVDPAHDDDRAFGWWSPERFAWRLADTVMFDEAIPHTGRQEALYPPDLELREAIGARLRGMLGAR